MTRYSILQLIARVLLITMLFASSAWSISEDDISLSIDKFGLRLFQKVVSATDRDSNVCLSPLSVSYALTMTYNGAGGETQKAMASTLAISEFLESDVDINDAYQALTSFLTEIEEQVEVQIANSIWIRLNEPIKADFTQLCQSRFNAFIRELDFAQPEAVDEINKWVAINTHDRIKRIINPPLDPAVVMLLINAIYFNAPWEIPFNPEFTKPEIFYLPDGSQSTCQMMHSLNSFDYLENELFQAVDLPYGDGKLGMMVILPKESMAVDDIVKKLNLTEVDRWMRDFEPTNIRLYLPRLKFSSDFGLNQTLKAMGMEIAFDPSRADFSNMVDGRIWIDSVIHKTFIQMDEKGTEAAAATAVIMKKGFVPTMKIDRPFLFMIRERLSGTIFFLGKVVNPVWEDE